VEYKFAVECMKRGLSVSMPLLESSKYDCLIDDGSNIYKIQIKSNFLNLKENKSSIKVNLTSLNKCYSVKDVDFFAVYVKYFDGFFIFKNDGKIQSKRFSLNNVNSKYFNNFGFCLYS